MSGDHGSTLTVLRHPYVDLVPLTGGRAGLKEVARSPGSAVVWRMRSTGVPPEADLLRLRPGGVALLVVLPDAERLLRRPDLVQLVQELRPQSILPDHHQPSPRDLAQILRRPPNDLPADVTDYLAWRGLRLDGDTVRLVRRIVELSADVRSVSGLARSMYISRRALGRRFMTLGLPVPSHWLQMSRLLRVTLRLQNSDATVFSVGYQYGYPDGFSVSNQMYRLIGHRPTEVRERLGWEWILEAWLRREAEAGNLSPHLTARVSAGRASARKGDGTETSTRRGAKRSRQSA